MCMCSLPTDSNKYFIAARSANCTVRKDTCVFACEDMRIIKSKNTTRLTIKNKSRIQKKMGVERKNFQRPATVLINDNPITYES